MVSSLLIYALTFAASIYVIGASNASTLSAPPSTNKFAVPLCTEPSIQLNPCSKNDTYCGDWKERVYIPNNCRYRSFTAEQARKCVGNRTIAFAGDSIIRDIGIGLAMFLSGEKVEEGLDYKFDKKAEIHTHWTNATKIGSFKSWKFNKDNYNGLLFPKVENQSMHFEWQIQIWELHCNRYIHDNLEKVFANKMIKENPLLHKIDFAFWSHGLHDYGWWDTPPYGKRFYEQMVMQWIRMRDRVPTPVVWVSINPHCVAKNPLPMGRNKPGAFALQAHMVEEANRLTSDNLRRLGLPYWDAGRPLRSPDLCKVTGDGVHVKMWVDLVRAQMLLNHLCDEDFNWVGDIKRF